MGDTGWVSARAALREVVWIAGMYALYNLGRMVAARNTGEALDNAHHLWRIERLLHLPSEQAVQALALDTSRSLVEAANAYYASVHFPLTLGVLVFLFVRHPDTYVWMRRSLVVVSLTALVGFLFFPLAPPRMLGGLGLVDTGAMFGMSVYTPSTQTSLTNQFAAMPSLHVAWAALVALAMIRCLRSPWRWLWLLHPVVTFWVVVVTANHYWLDGVVGLALLGLATSLASASILPRVRRSSELRVR